MPWFPITDPAREGDIRMRRRRAMLLLGSIVFVPWMVWGDHHATRSPSRIHVMPRVPSVTHGAGDTASTRRIAADGLRIDLPCASQVTVLPDPALYGQAVLSAPSAVLDALSISGGAIAGSGCADDSPIIIRTGKAMPISLVESGDNDIHAGRFDSAITIDSSGSGTVDIEHAGALTVRDIGSGDVTVGSVAGQVTATMQGSGDLRIADGTIPVLDAVSRGSADLLLDHVQVLGGRVTLNGSGGLRLGTSSGSFEAITRSSGAIVIGTATNDRLTLQGYGSGDIKVGGGHVNWLDATRRGSGDLAVAAAIDSGRLRHEGSGEVDVPPGASLDRSGR